MAKTFYIKASSRFLESDRESYDNIVSIFESLNIGVIDEAVLLAKNQNTSQQGLTLFYREVFDKIKAADALICEVSVSSSTTGYEVAYALSLNKPVLLLAKDTFDDKPIPFSVNPSKLLTYTTYNSTNLKAKIKQFLRKVEKGIFVKRLPIEFTKGQVDYVEYRQRRDGKKISFNSAVRALIDEAIDADMVYRDLLKDEE